MSSNTTEVLNVETSSITPDAVPVPSNDDATKETSSSDYK